MWKIIDSSLLKITYSSDSHSFKPSAQIGAHHAILQPHEQRPTTNGNAPPLICTLLPGHLSFFRFSERHTRRARGAIKYNGGGLRCSSTALRVLPVANRYLSCLCIKRRLILFVLCRNLHTDFQQGSNMNCEYVFIKKPCLITPLIL